MKMSFYILGVLILLVFSFQNCAPKDFSKGDDARSVGCENGLCNDQLQCLMGTPMDSSMQTSWMGYHNNACLTTPSYLNGSSVGFELSETHASTFDLYPDDASGKTPADSYLYIEIATYAHPDSFIITYDTDEQNGIRLFDVCNVATWTEAIRPEFMTSRPYSSTIVQYGVSNNPESSYSLRLPAGTKRLHFDFGRINSGNYIGIWNLTAFRNSLMNIRQNFFNRNYGISSTTVNGPNPSPGAALPGQMNANDTGNAANSFICPAINSDGMGPFACYSPGNFRFHTEGLTRYNDANDPNWDHSVTCTN